MGDIYIYFLPCKPTGTTKIWEVLAKDGDSVLGTIKWFSRWRKYAFWPEPNAQTIFEHHCLRHIADFCERESKAFWAEKRK